MGDDDRRAPAGAYKLLVRVDQARDLQPKDSDGAQPIVKISLVNTNAKPSYYFTEVQDNPRDVIWDDNKQFQFTIEDPSELELAKIKYELFDYNAATKSELIGSFQYDLTAVWEALDDPSDEESKHRKLRKWVPLTIATAERMKPQGFLKQTCTLVPEGFPIPEQPLDDGDDDQIEVEAMPSMEQEVWELLVHVGKAQHLPAMDATGTTGLDPYVRVEFGEIKRETRVITADQLGDGQPHSPQKGEDEAGHTPSGLREAFWKETISIKLSVPKGGSPPSKAVRLSVWDYDSAGGDDRVASYGGGSLIHSSRGRTAQHSTAHSRLLSVFSSPCLTCPGLCVCVCHGGRGGVG
eukprot:SAG22_NODE_84_length_21617_cov_48.600102_1_plen_351_part_00